MGNMAFENHWPSGLTKEKKADIEAENAAYWVAYRKARENYEKALEACGTDVLAHGRMVIESGDVDLNYRFARDVEGADVLAHGQVVIEKGSAYDNYIYARDVKGADIKAHGEAVLRNDAHANFLFAQNIKGADVLAHGRMVIEGCSAEYNYKFAYNVKGADVLAHGQVVIRSKDPLYNYWFAQDVKGADVLAHGRAVIESGSNLYNISFSRDIEGADRKAHIEAARSKEDYDFNLRGLRGYYIDLLKNEEKAMTTTERGQRFSLPHDSYSLVDLGEPTDREISTGAGNKSCTLARVWWDQFELEGYPYNPNPKSRTSIVRPFYYDMPGKKRFFNVEDGVLVTHEGIPSYWGADVTDDVEKEIYNINLVLPSDATKLDGKPFVLQKNQCMMVLFKDGTLGLVEKIVGVKKAHTTTTYANGKEVQDGGVAYHLLGPIRAKKTEGGIQVGAGMATMFEEYEKFIAICRGRHPEHRDEKYVIDNVLPTQAFEVQKPLEAIDSALKLSAAIMSPFYKQSKQVRSDVLRKLRELNLYNSKLKDCPIVIHTPTGKEVF